MSPRLRRLVSPPPCFPRVSGDEPARAEREQAETSFSPRERG